mgnify:CR=1 FL=1|jgi:hypothetical protein
MLEATSGIIYVRARLRSFTDHIKQAGGVIEFLCNSFSFDEILVPYFLGARPFWRPVPHLPRITNSGALGKMVASYHNAFISRHPSHSFAGIGAQITDVLKLHDYNTSCFFPITELARRYDFSMLLLACLKESPGFSTVHAVQYKLGLSQKHLIRYLYRWDIDEVNGTRSIKAKEVPGCSASFDKFYALYEKDGNLIRGELFGQPYLFIKSARQAMKSENDILKMNPRFVDCGNMFCPTCRFRLY